MIDLDLKLKIKSNKRPNSRSKLESKNNGNFWKNVFEQAIGGLISGIPLLFLGIWLGLVFKSQ